MISECKIKCYAKGLAYFTIGFSLPYLLLSIKVKKTNPQLFRKLLIIPTIVAFHGLTYIPKDLDKCEQNQQQQKRMANSSS
ncbi:hypothetical protein DERF_009748 [Dermatophagoides farinae]|uniref:Uncharacterized protein n=1 Tax=Dermatophagoides farinae TaxID=6954 RepID=A0A922HUJ4_DERFA|nr:hypothetical protein HUG17_7588 [Dermatophagoides farinae]KAH9511280.1 hypothetical protein DERF_009748 [Dermatophagoides farinae]